MGCMDELSRVKEGLGNITKLDMIDKKIIRALFSNKRINQKEISKKARVSKEVVNYRLNNLQKNEILVGNVAIINNLKLGYLCSITYLKLQKINKVREMEIIDFFVNQDYVKAIATCTGHWDIFIVCSSKNIIQYNDVLREFENFCGENLKKKRSAIILEEYFLPYDYIFKENGNIIKKQKVKNKMIIDFIDKKILKKISTNSSMRLVELAKKTKLTPEAVSYRIKKLTENKIITNFFPLINISKLGYHWHTVSLYLHNLNKKRENQLIKYLKDHPNIVVVIKTVGEWNLEFDVHVKTSQEFREILMSIREEFSDIINDFESNLIFADYKYTHFPDGLMK